MIGLVAVGSGLAMRGVSEDRRLCEGGIPVEETGPRYAVRVFEGVIPYELDFGVMFHDMVRSEHGSRALVSGFATFEPGCALPLHTHNVEEVVTVLEGDAECEVDGQTCCLRTHDTTFVRPGVPHRFRNLSQVSLLRILWVYAQVDDQGRRVRVERNVLA